MVKAKVRTGEYANENEVTRDGHGHAWHVIELSKTGGTTKLAQLVML